MSEPGWTFGLFAAVGLILVAAAVKVTVSETRKSIDHRRRVRAAVLDALHRVPGLTAGALRWVLATNGTLTSGLKDGDPSFDRQLKRLLFWGWIERNRKARLYISARGVRLYRRRRDRQDSTQADTHLPAREQTR